MEFYHRPVLLDECLNGLAIREDGAYLDGTLGGGGHSSEILKRLTAGRLIGIDRDADALKAATSRIHALQTDGLPRFDALYGNFHDAKALLEGIGIEKIDGALLDLGVSSYQLDEGSRGFSYHADAPLDMRMDRRQALTAAVIVNEWPENEIARVIRDWGEENWAVQIARVICDRRKLKRIETTGDLVSIIDAAIPKKFREKDGSHPRGARSRDCASPSTTSWLRSRTRCETSRRCSIPADGCASSRFTRWRIAWSRTPSNR